MANKKILFLSKFCIQSVCSLGLSFNGGHFLPHVPPPKFSKSFSPPQAEIFSKNIGFNSDLVTYLPVPTPPLQDFSPSSKKRRYTPPPQKKLPLGFVDASKGFWFFTFCADVSYKSNENSSQVPSILKP